MTRDEQLWWLRLFAHLGMNELRACEVLHLMEEEEQQHWYVEPYVPHHAAELRHA